MVITSAKKTFFAGGDLNDLRLGHQGAGRPGVRRVRARAQGTAAPPGDAGRAGGRGDQRRGAGRRPGDLPGLPPPDRTGRGQRAARASPRCSSGCCPGAGGVVRTVRMLGIVDALLALLLQGQRHRPGKAKELGIVDELVADCARSWCRPPRRGSRPTPMRTSSRGIATATRSRAARRRTRSSPRTCRRSRPTCASSSRAQLPGAAPHHGRGGRGRAARLRQRDRGRGPLLHRPGHRPGRQEHDPGVLLRHAAGQRRPRPARGDRDVRSRAAGRARRRDDGRRDRLCVREGRARGRAQGRLARAPRSAASSTPRSWSRRPSRSGRQTEEDGAGAAGPDHPVRRSGGRRRLQARDRGRVRGPERQGTGVRRDRAAP